MAVHAIGCQEEIAAQIVSAGNGYLHGVKRSQPDLQEDIRLFFEGDGQPPGDSELHEDWRRKPRTHWDPTAPDLD